MARGASAPGGGASDFLRPVLIFPRHTACLVPRRRLGVRRINAGDDVNCESVVARPFRAGCRSPGAGDRGGSADGLLYVCGEGSAPVGQRMEVMGKAGPRVGGGFVEKRLAKVALRLTLSAVVGPLLVAQG